MILWLELIFASTFAIFERGFKFILISLQNKLRSRSSEGGGEQFKLHSEEFLFEENLKDFIQKRLGKHKRGREGERKKKQSRRGRRKEVSGKRMRLDRERRKDGRVGGR